MKAQVLGGSGYTGGELIRILLGHPAIDEIEATSRRYEGKPFSKVHPNLSGFTDASFKAYKKGDVDADIVFAALPHGESLNTVPTLFEAGIPVIDLSADYRIADTSLYESYYTKHTSPELLEEAVYGLPELFRSDIAGAKLIANPGCYVTAAILSLAPLAKAKGADIGKVIVDAKSGTSGAGAAAKTFTLFSEVSENPKPYSVTGHRHEPEINHILQKLDDGFAVSFTPTLMPTVRGILSHAHVYGDFTQDGLESAYEKSYADEPFIRLVEAAYPKAVWGTNLCDISVHADEKNGRAVLISALDNLVKGAAGQAVQNMNIMMGRQETKGLDRVPYHP